MPGGGGGSHFYWEEGRRWQWAATDGACSDASHPMLARAGYGVFLAPGHRLNASARLPGPAQSAVRAEIAALVHFTAVAEGHYHVLIDNQAVEQQFNDIINGIPGPVRAHQDL